MKKTLWMLGVAVAALTSCTQSEVLDVPESKMIAFDSFVGKPTRAIDDVGDAKNFDVFYVYADKGVTSEGLFTADTDGSNFFNGEKVHRTKSSEDAWYNWTYTTPKPWTVDKTYRFAAYANGHGNTGDEAKLTTGVAFASKKSNVTSLSGTSITETWGLTFTNYQATTKDLIVSVPNEEKRSTTAQLVNTMNLTFSHALAKVVFRFVLDQRADGDLIVNVDPFNLNAITNSDCNVYYNDGTEINWASQSIKATDVGQSNWTSTGNIANGIYEIVPSGGLELKADDTTTDEVENDKSIAFYVIPQSNDITVTFTGTSTDAYGNVVGTTTFSNVSLKITDHEEWKPGYVYRYTASLNPQINYIHFAASVDAWADTPNRDQGLTGSTSGQNN